MDDNAKEAKRRQEMADIAKARRDGAAGRPMTIEEKLSPRNPNQIAAND